jgi:hypothetical protein
MPALALSRQGQKETFLLPRELRVKPYRLHARLIEANTRALEALRDMRWKLLAFRAKHEDPGDAPVFSDPEALIQYLNAK